MNLKTFTGPTMIACLSQVKVEMGPNAVILHTRSFHKRFWLGLRKREFVEITAGRGMNVPGKTFMQPQPAAMPKINPLLNKAAALTSMASSAMTVATAASANASPQMRAYLDVPATRSVPVNANLPALNGPSRALLETPAAERIVGMKVAQDVEELKQLVSGLVDRMQKKDAPQVPEELFNYYLKLIENDVAEELASEIMQSLRLQLRPEALLNENIVREKLADHIEALIPTTGPIVRKKLDGPHIVALIGPTGVGKTTTLAKLAATLKLKEKRRVGLITLDTFRIAAIDQLKKYADILRIDLKVVGTADDLREAIASMQDCEFILIDTAGRSPRDAMKISELKGFLELANPDEVHLVLSSTASQDCVEFAIERFGDVKFDKVIFTKLDEATHVGTLLNVIKKVNKSLSYVTTGQDVPNDIEVGQGRRLAQWIIGSESLDC